MEDRRVLRSARLMHGGERLNVEISQTGEKYRLIFYKIDELLQFACIWACFDVGGQACTTFGMHNAVKRAFKRRSISNGREISLNLLQYPRIIVICVYLVSRPTLRTCRNENIDNRNTQTTQVSTRIPKNKHTVQ